MPLRSYHARHKPPSFWDHMFAHDYEVVLAVLHIIAGLLGVTGVVLPDFPIPVSIQRLPMPLAGALCVVLLAAGVFILAGIYSHAEDLMVGYRRERAGLILSCAAWTAFAVVVLVSFPASTFFWLIGFALAAGAAVRFAATIVEERSYRALPTPSELIAPPDPDPEGQP